MNQIFDHSGKFDTLTEDDGEDKFDRPKFLGLDSEGDILVADSTRAVRCLRRGVPTNQRCALKLQPRTNPCADVVLLC